METYFFIKNWLGFKAKINLANHRKFCCVERKESNGGT